MKALFAALFTACLSALFPAAISAQARPLKLEYSVPKGCLSEEEFRDEVAARLGSIPFAEAGAPLTINIVAQNRGGWLGTLELDDRQRVLKNDDCPTLARDLAAALAVLLDAPEVQPPRPQGGVIGGVITGNPPPENKKVPIDVRAEDENLTLYVIRGQQLAYGSVGGYASTAVGYNFESLCTAPCKLELEPNDYHFAVGRGVSTPLPLNNRVRVTGPSRFDLDYRSRAWVRVVGLLVAIGGSAAGLGIFVRGLTHDSTPQVITGSVVMGSTLLVGMIMGMIGDKNSLNLTPAQ